MLTNWKQFISGRAIFRKTDHTYEMKIPEDFEVFVTKSETHHYTNLFEASGPGAHGRKGPLKSKAIRWMTLRKKLS